MFEEITNFTLRIDPEEQASNGFLRPLPIAIECACGSLGQLPVEIINVPGNENLPRRAVNRIDDIAQAYQGDMKDRLLQALNWHGLRKHFFVMLLSTPSQSGGRPILKGWQIAEYVVDRKVVPWRSEAEGNDVLKALGLLRDQMRRTGWLLYSRPTLETKNAVRAIPPFLDFRA